MSKHRRRAGFTLIEVVVYMAVLTLVMSLASAAYSRCLLGSRRLIRNSQDIMAAMRAGEAWRRDVRAAVIMPRLDGNTLHIQQSAGEVRYRFTAGAVERSLAAEEDWTVALRAVKSSRMTLEKRSNVSVLRWELELQSASATPRTRPLFTFIAVPASARAPQRPSSGGE